MGSAAFEPVAMKFHVTSPYSSHHQRLCPVYKPVRGCWQFKRNVPDDRRQNVSILFRRQTLQSAGFSVGKSTTLQAEQGGRGPQWCDTSPDREAVRHCLARLGHAHGWTRHDTQLLPPMFPQHEGPNVETASNQAAPGWRPIPKTGQLWDLSRHSQHTSVPSHRAHYWPQPRPPQSPCQSVSEHPIQKDGTCRGHVPIVYLELSDAQTLSGDQPGYALYKVSVVYDIKFCAGPLCVIKEAGVKAECEFEAD